MNNKAKLSQCLSDGRDGSVSVRCFSTEGTQNIHRSCNNRSSIGRNNTAWLTIDHASIARETTTAKDGSHHALTDVERPSPPHGQDAQTRANHSIGANFITIKVTDADAICTNRR